MVKRNMFTAIIAFIGGMASYAQDSWNITCSKVESDSYSGIMLANGMTGMVTSPMPLSVEDVRLSGVYDNGLLQNSFNIMSMKLYVDEELIDLSNIMEYRHTLNMKEAVLEASFVFKDKLKVEYKYMALRHLPYVLMGDVTLTPLRDINIKVVNNVVLPQNTVDGKFEYTGFTEKIRGLISMGYTLNRDVYLCSASSFVFDEPFDKAPELKHEYYGAYNQGQSFTKKLNANQKYSFGLIGSTFSSECHAEPYQEVKRMNCYAYLEGRERLYKKHIDEWKELWKSDIVIEGDKQAQQDIHNMIYHLYSSVRENTALSIPPMGLSKLYYSGHIFWDAELWMYPAILLLQPNLAKSMIEYRYEHLSAAKKNAMMHGYSGAMYPWESANSGLEETISWYLTGTFEHHITSCVAMAAWQYYCVTQDEDWLREKGYKIITEAADFWVSRSEKKDDHYEILNVIGPDEHAENIDNDAFTNAAASKTLQVAIKASKLLRKKIKPEWNEVSKGLIVHEFPDGTTRQHKTYNGEMIKQADVALLAYPLDYITSEEQIRKNIAYYEQKLNPAGPAMSRAIYSLLFARMQDADKAYELFKASYEPNLYGPFRTFAESRGGDNPYFMTGAGGVLQSIMMGFGGLHITDDGVKQKSPILPSNWEKMEIRGIGINENDYIIKK